MKIFQVNKLQGNFKPYYLDDEHLIDFLSRLPLAEPVTIGLLIDDSILNCVNDEISK